MNEIDIAVGASWHPFAWLGLTHPFFTIGQEEIHVIIQTWIILCILFLVCLPVRWLLKNRFGIARYLIISAVDTMIGLCKQAMGVLVFPHLAFVTSIFIFILFCNLVPIIPWMEEPTKNLNTTLALAITSFIYTQYHGIRVNGLRGYLKEYTEPFLLMAPLHVISKLASIVSMSFRLFGNIYGGAMITSLYMTLIKRNIIFELIGLGSGLNFVIIFFFCLFEGFLQAFVFTMLSLTYLSIAIAHDEQESTERISA
jgi:F-type H+-transporting ATPase subunit a